MSNCDDDYILRQRAEEVKYREAYSAWVDSLSEKERRHLASLGLDKAHIDSVGVGSPELDESRIVGSPGWGSPMEIADDPATDAEEGMNSACSESLQDSLRVMVAELFEHPTPGLAIGIVGAALRVDGCHPKLVAARFRRREAWVKDEAIKMRFRIGITCLEDETALARVIGELAATSSPRLSLEVLALVSGICYQGLSQTAIADRYGVTRAAVSKRCVELTEKLGLPPSRAMRSEASRVVCSEAQRRAWEAGKRRRERTDSV